MRDVDIARWRLRSQHLVRPHAGSADEAVGALLAVQAENPGQSAWAVASRTPAPDQADLASLLDDGAVVRTHVLRPTWHYVRAEDIGWLLELTAPRVQRITGKQLRDTHGLDAPAIDRATTAVMEALESRGHLTRAQLAEELRDLAVPPPSKEKRMQDPSDSIDSFEPETNGQSMGADSPVTDDPTPDSDDDSATASAILEMSPYEARTWTALEAHWQRKADRRRLMPAKARAAVGAAQGSGVVEVTA